MTGIGDLTRERTRLRVTGADRVAFLQGQCTNDIGRLQVGQSCYAAFLNAKGKMRGDAYIVSLEEAFLLEANVGLRESLEKFVITEDVTIEDVSASLQAWLVVGSVPTLLVDAVTFAHALGCGVLTATAPAVTLDEGAMESLRIEAGVAKWGVDMDENTIPVEAGLAVRAISYDKGCYIGQETIARIKTYGHVNRHLVQLAGAATLPAQGGKLLAGEKEVGQVTSAVRSNRLGKVLALGYVRREFVKAGTVLQAGDQSWEIIKICGE